MRLGKVRARIEDPEVFCYSILAGMVGIVVIVTRGISFDAILMLLLSFLALLASIRFNDGAHR